ncbi:Beta-fructofuranosidase (invertase) [Handroanthus impetiginosus]|uniref:Beta-fructofuranosidase (Invertase) n=1 Tax=Handroanthus impetiginosus TaxID=429701 RepID=A0A2G9H6T1_9LAMI|nr:Beta-fructofuranosidase (invertase) [Handroanthus impetiginosus]
MERFVIKVIFSYIILIGFGVQIIGGVQEQPLRTAFHFRPPKNWMNGPMYYKGVYHLFYQYNPDAAVWGNISWGHSVSYNLIDWFHLQDAMNPNEPYDINGCWSGSTTILPGPNIPVILYTGNNFADEEVQNLATPKNLSDPMLQEWVKSKHNPIMSPVDDIDPKFYRDPTTAWLKPDHKTWCTLVGAQINGYGAAFLYKSSDFITWKKADKTFHLSNKTDIDLDYYIIGKYDWENDGFKADFEFMDERIRLRYDYGIFYASKTFYDEAKKRRVLWGWVTEADHPADDMRKGWSGLQSIPRSILLDKSGEQLIQWPVKEVEKLRGRKVTIKDKEINSETVLEVAGITASQADVEVSFRLSHLKGVESIDESSYDPQLLCSQMNASVRGAYGPFGLLAFASKDLKEQTAVFFRVLKRQDKFVVLMCTDQSRSSLKTPVKETIFGSFLDVDPNQKISLRTLTDHSIIEAFGGEGKSCITARVYPKLAIGKNSHIFAFNNGSKSVKISSLNAWSMNKAHIAKAHDHNQ